MPYVDLGGLLSLYFAFDETQALLGDVADMERLVDEFLAFARGDATEEPEETDLAALVARLVENAARAGQRVELQGAMVVRLRLRPQAVTRALQNLLNNANRFGNRVIFAGALMHGLGVTEAQPGSIAADEVRALAKEILTYLNRKTAGEKQRA